MADLGTGYPTTHTLGSKPKSPAGMPSTPNSGAQPLSFAPPSAPTPQAVISKEALFDKGIGELYDAYKRHGRGLSDVTAHHPEKLPEVLERYRAARNALAGRAALYGGATAAGAAGVYGIGRAVANRMGDPTPTTDSESFEGG